MATSVIGNLRVLLGLDAGGFTKGLGDAGRTAGETAGMFSSLTKTVAGVAGGLVAAQAVIGGLKSAFSFASHAAIDMNASLEKSTLQFATLMGDSDRAAEHVRDLFKFAKDTPFETEPIIAASRSMRTFGGEALDTMDNLTLLGDAAAATGAPIDQLGFWVGRMFAALKGGQPIGEATMRLMELGVLTPQTRVQMEALAKSAGGGEKAFNLFKDSLGNFQGAMVAQANTWDGLMSSISDAINLTLADALKPFFDTVKVGAQIVLQALGSDGMQKVFGGLKEKLGGVFGGDGQGMVKKLGGALLSFATVGVTAAEWVVKAFDGLKVVFASVASGIAAIIGAAANNFDALVAAASKIPGIGGKFDSMKASVHDAALQIEGMRKSFTDQAAAALEGVKGNSAFGKIAEVARDAITGMRRELDAATVATNAAAAATKNHAGATSDTTVKTKEQIKAEAELQKAHEKFAASVTRLDTAEWFVPFKAGVKESTQELEPLTSKIDIATRAMSRFKASIKENLPDSTQWAQAWEGMRDGLNVALAQIPATLVKAFEGGGDIWGAVKSIASQIGSTIGGAIGKGMSGGSEFGKQIGAAIGSLAGPLLEGLKKMFGIGIDPAITKANESIQKLRDELLKTYGTMDQLEAQANRFGFSFKTLWTETGPRGLQMMQASADFLQRTLAALAEASSRVITGYSAVVTGMTAPWIELGKRIDDARQKASDAQGALTGTGENAPDDSTKEKAAAAVADLNNLLAEQQRMAQGAKQQLADLGIGAVATFGAALAAGKSYSEAIKEVGPSIKTLGDSYKALGLDVEDVGVKNLILQSTVAGGNPQLMSAVEGLAGMTSGLAQMGLLNVDTFGAMERTGMALYTRLQGEVNNTADASMSMGDKTRAALLPMQGYLQEAAAKARELKIPLDDNTQMLIDQSRELGIWKDKGKTAQDKMIEGMQAVVNKVDELLTKIMGVGTSISNIPNTKDVTLRMHYEDPGPPPGWGGGGGDTNAGDDPGHAVGTMGRWGSWFKNFGGGFATSLHHMEAVITPAQSVPFAMDVLSNLAGGTPAMAGGNGDLVDAVGRLERTLLSTMPTMVADAARHAVQTAGRRR